MLILDKRKAVERVMALTAGTGEIEGAEPMALALHPHTRTYQRIATYERRAHVAPIRRVVEPQRYVRVRLAGDASPA
jgi:hypothetical protein